MKSIRKMLDQLVEIEKKVCVSFLIIMLFINFAQVLLRYVFNKPFHWSEEIILLFLVWFGFICMSIDIEKDSHVAITGLYNMFPRVLKKAADLIRHALLIVFFAFMVKYGYQLMQLSMRKKLPASQISQGWQYAPVLLGGSLMLLFSVVNLLEVLFHSNTQEKGEV